jgi:SagB-type dehydrogenase family enzyme
VVRAVRSHSIAEKDKLNSTQKALRYKRSETLVLYWQNDELVFENFARRAKITADPLTCSILHRCAGWQSAAEICNFLSDFDEASIRESLDELCANGVLERSDTPIRRHQSVKTWEAWNPAAGFFHFSTKDTEFAADQRGAWEELRTRANHEPMPEPRKNDTGARRIKLPPARSGGEFAKVLRNRRTWRVFGKEAVPIEILAQLLQLTFGIQRWTDVPGLGRAALKTSPSCGGLHPIEANVLALRVKGLHKGFFHYNAERHELKRLRGSISSAALEKNLGNQWWFSKAAFLVIMSAVFARTRWKYEMPRVYRGILMEAGHLCQTFCLTATWKGLAPFSTIAYADTQWEKWLGLDGVSESVLYIAGAGARPKNLKSAHLGAL